MVLRHSCSSAWIGAYQARLSGSDTPQAQLAARQQGPLFEKEASLLPIDSNRMSRRSRVQREPNGALERPPGPTQVRRLRRRSATMTVSPRAGRP